MKVKLNQYFSFFSNNILIHSGDLHIIKQLSVQNNIQSSNQVASYTQFVLNYSMNNPYNCIANYINPKEIRYIQEQNVLFTPQFIRFYQLYNLQMNSLFKARLYLYKSNIYQLTGLIDFTISCYHKKSSIYQINIQQTINLQGSFRNIKRSIIHRLNTYRMLISKLDNIVEITKMKNVLHTFLLPTFKQSRFLKTILNNFFYQINDENCPSIQVYQDEIVIPLLSQNFIFSQGKFIKREFVNITNLQLNCIEIQDEQYLSSILLPMPKKQYFIRPLIISKNNFQLLSILRSLYNYKQFISVKSCLEQVTTKYFLDVNNAFSIVNQHELFQLLKTKILQNSQSFYSIEWQPIQDIMYPVQIIRYQKDELINLLHDHILQFKFFDLTNHKKYQLTEGIPQGSPLSPFLFHIWMDFKVSQSILRFSALNKEEIIVRRYVDNFIVSKNVNLFDFETRKTNEFCGYYEDITNQIRCITDISYKRINIMLTQIQKSNISYTSKISLKYLLLKIAQNRGQNAFSPLLQMLEKILDRSFPKEYDRIFGIFMQLQMDKMHNKKQ